MRSGGLIFVALLLGGWGSPTSSLDSARRSLL
jgi:hypothetical protein